MTVVVLRVLALLGSGIAAGVLFAVALSVLPALFAMPPERYVYAHRLLGRNFDPTMPLVVLGTVAADTALAALVPEHRVLFVIAAVLSLGVSAVSHLCNVPINRRVKAVDETALPPDWRDPRPSWRRWHLLRTVLAILAFLTCALAA
ncbi:DUF1772 domain-containing protein [Actinokineospora enzanensis]|uniref:anthrone oxygenase family protein n=1 Tax=Actinokineospora enzanensis TaxID=155975 RepID=UPI0003806214|nr:DUF1772 domain-containing protein [Actinokineospora enzanensis]